MTNKRLLRELKDIIKNPIDNIISRPIEENILLWNYVFVIDREPYKGGYYHGIIEFDKEYPMKPPEIKMFTPNGRFEIDKRLCLSMSDYHPETWNPSWGVRTILLGLYSFMLDDDFSEGTIGSIRTPDTYRKNLAIKSLDFNKSNTSFMELYKEFIKSNKIKLDTQEEKPMCRYCFEDTGELISPCNCEGSNKYVHRECLAKWQYNSILAQSTHPKYQTNIEKICNVCNGEFKVKEYSRDELMLQFTGQELSDMIQKGCYLVSSKKSSSSNLELINKYKNDSDLCNNLKHWTKAVFLITNIIGKTPDIHVLAISLTNVISIDLCPQLYFDWIRLNKHYFFQLNKCITHIIGGPCNPRVPFYLINVKQKVIENLNFEMLNIVKVFSNGEDTYIFGQLYEFLNSFAYKSIHSVNNVFVIWGIAGWSKTQLLGEIARGGWGLSNPTILSYRNINSNLWNSIIEKERVLFCKNNDYLKIFKK